MMYGGDGNGNTKRLRRNTTILDLDDDVLALIFTRFSITTILQCKTVCKSFYLFLSSTFFTEAYQLNPPFTSLIIHNGYCFYLLQLKPGNKTNLLPDPFGLSHCGRGTRFLVGSCNGFFCFADKDVLYVSNPLSGTHIKLPEEEVLDVSTRTYGFGYCPQTQHYKVIELASFVRPFSRTEVHVFTVGVDKYWRRIHSPFYNIQQQRRDDYRYHIIHFLEVNGKGTLNWIVDDPNMYRILLQKNNKLNRLDYLYSFNITEETVRPIPPPVGLETRNEYTLLFSIHGRLCLLHKNDNPYEQDVQLWCMKEYMDQSSWTLRIISGTSLPEVLHSTRFQSVAFGKNDQDILMVLNHCRYGLVSCNLQQSKFYYHGIAYRGHYDRDVTCFVPNFFSRTIQGETKVDAAAARKLGLLTQKKSEPTEVGNGCVRITGNILSSRVVVNNTIRRAKSKSMPSSTYTVSLILCDKASPMALFTLQSDYYLSNHAEAFSGTSSSSMAKVTVLGSWNGVVCLSALNYDQTHSIYICNPVVQEIAILPQPKGDKRILDEAYGFGYSCVSRHYKVLRILTAKWCPGKFEAYVLTIGIDNKWRGVVRRGVGEIRMPKKFPPDINKARFCDVPFNNAIHWVGVGDSQLIIYAFDIDEERFTLLAHLPSVYSIRYHDVQPCLVILRGCLCLCVMNPQILDYVDLWSMRSYGSRASWERERILIPKVHHPGMYGRGLMQRVRLPVTRWKDGEILMWVEDCGGTLISYCSRKKTFTEIEIHIGAYTGGAALIAVPYVPSRLSLRDAVKNGNLEVKKMELPFEINRAPQIAPSPNAQNSPLVQNEVNLMAGDDFPDDLFNDDDPPQSAQNIRLQDETNLIDLPNFFNDHEAFQLVPVGQEITDVDMINILSSVQLSGIHTNHPHIQLIEADFYQYHPDDLLVGAYYITRNPYRKSKFGWWVSKEARRPVIAPGIEHPIGYTRRLSYKLAPLNVVVGYRMTEYTLPSMNLSLWGNPPPLVMCRITKNVSKNVLQSVAAMQRH